MAAQHKSARGIPVDMDRLRLSNETAIAVGNMKVNARGDQLGLGGKIVKTRAQVLAEKNKLHGNLASDDDVDFEKFDKNRSLPETVPDLVIPESNVVQASAVDENKPYVKPRGSFAEAVAGETEVTQELLDPSEVLKTPSNQPGIKRI